MQIKALDMTTFQLYSESTAVAALFEKKWYPTLYQYPL
jgi:hypothetical protein